MQTIDLPILAMVKKWRKTLDEGSETGAVLTDLSRAFYYIYHNLLIAKLNAYGFEEQSINFIHSYLTKGKQRTKIDSVVHGKCHFQVCLKARF